MAHPNLEMLRLAVTHLSELADELVFVGGCTTGLLITDPAVAEIRPTEDVDSIVEAATYFQYQEFAERLQKKGFAIDTSDGAPICRWVKGETVLDVMPVHGSALGFKNRWFKDAVETAQPYNIFEDINIRVITPLYFCAAKLEAFTDRGNDDYLASHDLEDFITIVNGRSELVDEIRSAPEDVQSYISEHVGSLLAERRFRDALPGHLRPDEARTPIVIERLVRISE